MARSPMFEPGHRARVFIPVIFLFVIWSSFLSRALARTLPAQISLRKPTLSKYPDSAAVHAQTVYDDAPTQPRSVPPQRAAVSPDLMLSLAFTTSASFFLGRIWKLDASRLSFVASSLCVRLSTYTGVLDILFLLDLCARAIAFYVVFDVLQDMLFQLRLVACRPPVLNPIARQRLQSESRPAVHVPIAPSSKSPAAALLSSSPSAPTPLSPLPTQTHPTLLHAHTRMPLHSISSTDLLFDPPAFDTSIEAWEGQLDYVNGKVEEWKVCGARDESGLYLDLRAFLMKAIREHMVLEKQVFSSVEDAYKYIRQRIPEERRQKLNVVLDSMSSGHAVRRQHLDEWERYAREQQGRGDARELGAAFGVVERMACEITRLKVMEKNLRRMKNELQVYVEDARERGVLDDGPRGEAAPEEKGD